MIHFTSYLRLGNKMVIGMNERLLQNVAVNLCRI